MGKLGTVVEHGAGACYFIGVPVGADINGDELAAVTEVPGRKVQGSKAAAPREHAVHACYLTCVPLRNIQGGEAAAVIEHAAHVRYLACVPVRNVQSGEAGAAREHRVVRLLQLQNMPPMFVTLLVFHPETSRVVSLLQP